MLGARANEWSAPALTFATTRDGARSREAWKRGGRGAEAQRRLNRALTASRGPRELLERVNGASGAALNSINTSAALHRLAVLWRESELQGASHRGGGFGRSVGKLLDGPGFRRLQARALEQAPEMDPRALASTAWALAAIPEWGAREGGAEVLAAVLPQVLAGLRHFRGPELTQVLWALASLGHAPDPGMLAALQARLQALAVGEDADAARLGPGEASIGLWSLAKLGGGQGPGDSGAATARGALVRCAERQLVAFSTQELSNVLWGLARARDYPGAAFLDAAALELQHRAGEFDPRNVASLLWSFATLGHDLPPEALKILSAEAERCMGLFGPRGLAVVLWAFARLGLSPSFLMAAVARCRELEEAGALGVRDLAMVSWSLVVIGDYTTPGVRAFLEAAWTSLCRYRPEDFKPAALSMLYYVWLALDQELPCPDREFPEKLSGAASGAWEDALRESSISSLQQDVSDTLKRMGFSHDSEALVEDGMFSVDILVDGQAAVIEVDGPHHFTQNTRRPLGPTLLRRRLLTSRGLQVVSVPFFEWDACSDFEAKCGLLARLLTCVLYPKVLESIDL